MLRLLRPVHTARPIFDPDAGPTGNRHLPVLHLDRRIEPASVFLGPQLVLLITPDIRHARSEMQHVYEPEPARNMHGRRHLRDLRHPRYAYRPDHPSVIVQVRLHNIYAAVGDHPPEAPVAVLLLSARHRNS